MNWLPSAALVEQVARVESAESASSQQAAVAPVGIVAAQADTAAAPVEIAAAQADTVVEPVGIVAVALDTGAAVLADTVVGAMQESLVDMAPPPPVDTAAAQLVDRPVEAVPVGIYFAVRQVLDRMDAPAVRPGLVWGRLRPLLDLPQVLPP